jgi:septum site-determining protein MinC
MLMLNTLSLSVTNISQISAILHRKVNNATQFFLHSPLVLDCQDLGEKCAVLDFSALYLVVKEVGFVPVGVRNVPDDCLKYIKQSEWALMRAVAKPSRKTVDSSEKSLRVLPQSHRVEVISRPLRSGQQVYAPTGDVVVLHQTSAGSEILADGSVHVYGTLRGRVLAGVNGEKTARIFCQSLEADLVAIAGCYQLLDDADTELKGQPAMIRLQEGRLIFEPLA